MKKLLYQYIEAMAIINPEACNNSSIQIELEQRNEGPIPHLHVYLDSTRNPNNCAYIRLDKAEYAPHHKSIKLNKQQKKEFISIMTLPWSRHITISIYDSDISRPATGYEAAVDTWIETYGETISFNYDEEGFLIMPDYTML